MMKENIEILMLMFVEKRAHEGYVLLRTNIDRSRGRFKLKQSQGSEIDSILEEAEACGFIFSKCSGFMLTYEGEKFAYSL